jgi:hypothetical protein
MIAAWSTTATRVGWLLLFGLGLCGSGRAHAQAASAEELGRARAFYNAGANAYAQGDLALAVQSFESAYALSHAKPLLFNIAQAYRLMGPAHCAETRDAYQRYLDADPNTSNRNEIQERIASADACAAQQPPRENTSARVPGPETVAPAAAPLVARASAGAARKDELPGAAPARAVPFALTFGGAALAIAGAGLYVRARVEYEHAQDTCPCPHGKYERWQNVTWASYGLLGAGGVALVGGVAWLLSVRLQRTQVALAPTGLRVTSSF